MKQWCPHTRVHGVSTQHASLWIFIALRPSILKCSKNVQDWSLFYQNTCSKVRSGHSQWAALSMARSAAARLLRLWVRFPPRAWMSVCCECCVLSGRGLCDELITRPYESYRLWCAVESYQETSWMRRPWPTGGLLRQKQNKIRSNWRVYRISKDSKNTLWGMGA